MRTSKQDENDGRPRPIPIISRPNGAHPIPQSINLPAHPTSTHETEERDAGTIERRANETSMGTTRTTDGRRGERRNENARAPQDNKQQRDAGQDARQDAKRDAKRDENDKVKASSRGRKIGGREEQTASFSHLSPDPLSPILSHPSASIIPPAPGRGTSRR